MKLIALLFCLPLISLAADNQISIDQAGDNNTITISQDSAGHTANVVLGKSSSVDNTSVSIDQRDASAKTATVEITAGYNNTVSILQQGIGNHNASILNLNGAANNFNISQSGSGNHSFTASATAGTVNNNNSITATQSGNSGFDKSFSLNLNGATGATVNVQQTNPLGTDSGSMTIQCLPGSCGSYSYIKQ